MVQLRVERLIRPLRSSTSHFKSSASQLLVNKLLYFHSWPLNLGTLSTMSMSAPEDLVKAVSLLSSLYVPLSKHETARNMMMFDYVLPYAIEFNSSAVLATRPDLTSQSTAADVPNDGQKNAIRATVLGDELSFASAAWFLRTQCGADIAQGLQAATAAGFNAYMGSGCVGAGQDPARLALYQATLTAMGQ